MLVLHSKTNGAVKTMNKLVNGACAVLAATFAMASPASAQVFHNGEWSFNSYINPIDDSVVRESVTYFTDQAAHEFELWVTCVSRGKPISLTY